MQPSSIERYWGVFYVRTDDPLQYRQVLGGFSFDKEVPMNNDKIRAALSSAWHSYHLHNDMLPGRLVPVPDADTMADLVYRVHDIWPRNPHLSLDKVCLNAVFWVHRMDDEECSVCALLN